MTRRPTAAAGHKPAAADPTGPPVDDQERPQIAHEHINIRIATGQTQNANWVMRGTMLNRTLLEGQGLFLKSHKALVEKLTDVLSYRLASPSFTMQPMLQETSGQLTVTPLGALTLASGAAVTRSSDPRVYTLDEGVFLPGPSFSERLGWKPQVPFDLREVNHLAATDLDRNTAAAIDAAGHGPAYCPRARHGPRPPPPPLAPPVRSAHHRNLHPAAACRRRLPPLPAADLVRRQ